MDDLMHYCTRLKAKCNSASGRPRYRGVIVWTLLQTGMKNICFIIQNLLMKYLAAFLEWSCCRRCGVVAKQKISPNLLSFGPKMFRSFLPRKRVPTPYVFDHKQCSYWSLKLPTHALLHNVSFHKQTVRASLSRMSISACVL